MSTPHHQEEPGARGLDAALPRLSVSLGLAKLAHPGMTVLELDAQRTALVPVIDMRLFAKGLR